jgi:DNA polymerase III subunit delta'
MQFVEVSGNKNLTSKLKVEVQSGRIPHARLFSGGEGDGKLRLALAYVQYLMCEQRTPQDSCGTCKACVKNAKLIHPDVHFSFPTIPKKSTDKPVSNDYLSQWRESVLKDQHLNVLEWLNFIGAENKQGNITAEECKSIISKLSLKPFESDSRVLLMWLPEYLGPIGNSLLKIMEEPPSKTYFVLVTEKIDHILPTILSRVQIRIKKFEMN